MKLTILFTLLALANATCNPEHKTNHHTPEHTHYPSHKYIIDPFQVIDQGNLGSCTAVAASYLIDYEGYKLDKDLDSSILFMYYNARENPIQDDGSTLGDIFDSVDEYGYSNEKCWPYQLYNWKHRPNLWCYYTDTIEIKPTHLTNDLDSIRWAINNYQPVAMGFDIDDLTFNNVSFDGVLDTEIDQLYVGWMGHAVVILGYDDTTELLMIRNSWGTHWGPYNGYFFMSYEYFENNVDSLWIVTH